MVTLLSSFCSPGDQAGNLPPASLLAVPSDRDNLAMAVLRPMLRSRVARYCVTEPSAQGPQEQVRRVPLRRLQQVQHSPDPAPAPAQGREDAAAALGLPRRAVQRFVHLRCSGREPASSCWSSWTTGPATVRAPTGTTARWSRVLSPGSFVERAAPRTWAFRPRPGTAKRRSSPRPAGDPVTLIRCHRPARHSPDSRRQNA